MTEDNFIFSKTSGGENYNYIIGKVVLFSDVLTCGHGIDEEWIIDINFGLEKSETFHFSTKQSAEEYLENLKEKINKFYSKNHLNQVL
jgi:hypothetical protein